MKQFRFLVFLMSMLFIGVSSVFAEDYAAKIVLTQNDDYTVKTNFNKFAEPTVKVQSSTGGQVTDLTHLYNIKYYISGHMLDDETKMATNHRKAKITRDATTGTEIELLFGDVVTGNNNGEVSIVIEATERANTTHVLDSVKYTLNVQTPAPELKFTPAFTQDGESNDIIPLSVMQTVEQNPYNTSLWDCHMTAASSTLPELTIIYKDIDVTEHYTITKTIQQGTASPNNNLSIKTNNGHEQISYAENTSQFSSESEAQSCTPANATITYTFTPKDANYPAIANKEVTVTFNKATEKQNLHLSLTQDMFRLDNVTSHIDPNNTNNQIYTVHVYKYGSQDHSEELTYRYKYYQPHPALINASGAILPVSAPNCAGTWGDFQYLYEVYDGKDNKGNNRKASDVISGESNNLLGTYYDDCQIAPFNAGSEYTKAGESTGIQATSDDMFQTGKPGLVLVKIYAVLPDDNTYGSNLREIYNPITDSEGNPLKITNTWGGKYVVYSQPVYYFIDVMKRIPTLSFSPDPSTLTFGKGDKIDMTNRFEVSGSIDANSNGIQGNLIWGSNVGENDHFAYTFFISQHAAQVITVNDWPCTFTKEEDGKTVADKEKWAANLWIHPATKEAFYGDQYSYISYSMVKENDPITKSAQAQPMIGDSILVSGNYVKVTADNLETYKTRGIKAGDFLKGTTYNSVKGYGAAFEKWSLTFEYQGTYEITYTIRPWNPTRWDVGGKEAGSKTYIYNIVETVPTEIQLSYYDTTTGQNSQWDFDEPEKKVKVISSQNDVTEHFDFHFDIDPSMPHDDSTGYTITEEEITSGNYAGTYSVYKKGSDAVLKVNKTTGEVFVGNIEEDVKVQVSATKKDTPEAAKYENPASKSYTIRVKDLSGNAKWEVMSSCRTEEKDLVAETRPRFTTSEALANENGRFHFIGEGTIIGGTQVRDVPGMVMTIGASGDESWNAEVSTIETLKHCCKHEDTKGNPVVVEGSIVMLNDEEIPTSGTFYMFQPTVNGFLALDANWQEGHTITIISKNSKTGVITKEEITVASGQAMQGDKMFTKPLIAGETYYVYNNTAGTLRMHGFTYQPAYINDNNTTKSNSESGLAGSLFMNGFLSGVPTIVNSKNERVTYEITKETTETTDHTSIFNTDASVYAEIDANTGKLTAKKMTVKADGSIFYLKVTATVHSTNDKLGDCTDKSSFFYVRIIDIPTYKIADYEEYSNNMVFNRLKVRTTNIPTALTMTFGGWAENGDGADNEYNGTKSDQWSYKSVAGPASRIGSELDDDDPTYNLIIDGFTYFNAGNQNPIDENNKGALQKDNGNGNVNNGNKYTYASGTAAETDKSKYYNTTYRLPCRGAFLKFEPEESGTLLLYIVQNGSVDYHYGISEVSTQHQLKWRPLYITDETGKTVEMLNTLSNDVSSLLPADNTPGVDIGAYTLGLSRCNPIEPAITQMMTNKNIKPQMSGCSFDWTEFRGTDDDKTKLLNAWSSKGSREKVIRLENGGFALPHKAYVRYAFNVKAGKTYFVFQPGSKFEFGGFSFVPTGYPNNSKYGLNWDSKTGNDMMQWQGQKNSSNKETNIDLTWKSNLNDFSAKENVNVTLIDAESGTKQRTFSKNKWNSICLPFSVNESQLTKKFGEDFILVTVDGVNAQGQLQFTRHANRYIEAGRPYLFKPTVDCKTLTDQGDAATHLTFENVSIEAGNTADLISGTQNIIDPSRFNVNVEEYTFKGFYTQHEMPKGSVYAATDGLYMYNGASTSTIGGYRALFHLPSEQSQFAKAMTFCINDMCETESKEQTTGIVYITNDDVRIFKSNSAIYTIDGKKVGEGADALNKLGKGIYIVDGQKIVR